MTSGKIVKLNQLRKNQSGKVIEFETNLAASEAAKYSDTSASLVKRMMEMGIVKGTILKFLHEAPFFKDPIAIEVRGALLALRRDEAELVKVEIE